MFHFINGQCQAALQNHYAGTTQTTYALRQTRQIICVETRSSTNPLLFAKRMRYEHTVRLPCIYSRSDLLMSRLVSTNSTLIS